MNKVDVFKTHRFDLDCTQLQSKNIGLLIKYNPSREFKNLNHTLPRFTFLGWWFWIYNPVGHSGITVYPRYE